VKQGGLKEVKFFIKQQIQVVHRQEHVLLRPTPLRQPRQARPHQQAHEVRSILFHINRVSTLKTVNSTCVHT
jgi:hypothetical protein